MQGNKALATRAFTTIQELAELFEPLCPFYIPEDIYHFGCKLSENLLLVTSNLQRVVNEVARRHITYSITRHS